MVQAYRQLVLKVHPDKNPDNPNAAKIFNEVQQAYDIALDPKAREAWMQLEKYVPCSTDQPDLAWLMSHSCLPDAVKLWCRKY